MFPDRLGNSGTLPLVFPLLQGGVRIRRRVHRIGTWSRRHEVKNEANGAGKRILLGNRYELALERLVERDKCAALILRVVS